MTEYEVRDASGALVAVHVRRDGPDGKSFYWRLPDGTPKLACPAADLPLYGIHLVQAEHQVVLTEGEGAAQALMDAGIPAVGTVTGAASVPTARVVADLAGKVVYLWHDADEPGRHHMERIAKLLAGVATGVRWIEPGQERVQGWDAADAIAEGGKKLAHSLIRASETLSFGPDAPSERKQLPFITARELSAETPAVVPWIAPPYIARGAITEVDGRPKAAGKSTFLIFLARAALEGELFLGERVTRTPVVFLTEQAPASLVPLLVRAGLGDRPDLHLLLWRDARGTSWPAIVEGAADYCRRVSADLLIVDTMPQFAGLGGDSENDAGNALAAMAPLQVAAADGLAVVIARHDRKGSGEVGESARGSSAFAGAVDIILALRRGDGESRPTIRHLYALSRFDETPDELVIELTDAGYVALGTSANFAVEEAKAAVLATVGEDALTLAQLVEATGLKRTTIHAAATELYAAGKLSREGDGKRGDPHRFFAAGFITEPISDDIGPNERNRASGDRLADEPLRPWDTSAMVARAVDA